MDHKPLETDGEHRSPAKSRARRRRVSFFMRGMGLFFLILVLQLGNLQFRQEAYWLRQADGNRLRENAILAPRGAILDRRGRVLAGNRPAYRVEIEPREVRDWDETVQGLARVLTADRPEQYGEVVEAIYRRVRDQGGRLYEPIVVRRGLSPELTSRIEERRSDLPGVNVRSEPQREYALGPAVAHVLGFVGAIRPQDKEDPAFAGYRSDELIGLTGLERQYERYLKGIDGAAIVEVDHRGRPLREVGQRAPVAGNSLRLTIDADLQESAVEALRRQLDWIGRQTEARGWERVLGHPPATSGSVVALEVHTGAVLAMASWPAYDPNLFASGLVDPDYLRQLEGDPGQPYTNWALTPGAPGSTFKMLTGIAALERNQVQPGEVINCTGVYPDLHRPRDWAPGGHGPVDLKKAVAKSCDIYFYEAGRRVGISGIAEYAALFGFGRPTGIDLPGEENGVNPTPAYKEKAFGEPWWEGETLSVAIGQGYLTATPLQLAHYVATIANGGTRYRPYLLQEVRDPEGTVIARTEPEVLGRVPVSERSLQLVREGMREVARGGTAAGVFSRFSLPVGAKTGTAETGVRRPDNALFVAFAPYEEPQIAVAVSINGGVHGSWAAQVANDVIAAYFNLPPVHADDVERAD